MSAEVSVGPRLSVLSKWKQIKEVEVKYLNRFKCCVQVKDLKGLKESADFLGLREMLVSVDEREKVCEESSEVQLTE